MCFWFPRDGHTALIWAALGGHVETFKCLIENGADVETENE